MMDYETGGQTGDSNAGEHYGSGLITTVNIHPYCPNEALI